MPAKSDRASPPRESPVIAVVLWALLAAAFLSPDLMTLFHSSVRLFTEGNAVAKSLLFVGFLALVMTARLVMPPSWKKRIPPWVKTAFMASVVLSMLWGVVLQMYFLRTLNANVNSFVSHVTDCGGVWCWEGTYFQHNHVTKTAVYFFEKTLGVSLGSQVDNGKPIYDIIPWAPLAAPPTALLFLLVFAFGTLWALREDDGWGALLAQAATLLFAIATVDGGIFSMTGINAVALLAIALWHGRRDAPSEEKFVFPLAIAVFVAFLPNLLFGSFLYYRDWFAGTAMLAAFFAFVDAKQGSRKLAFLGVFVLTALLFAGSVYELVYGSGARIYRTAHYLDGFPDAPNLFIYGLPPAASADQVRALVPEFTFSSFAKYGWYFVGSPSSPDTIRLRTNQLADRLRLAFPQGYLYVDANHDAYQFQQAYVLWNARPPVSPAYDGELFSMRVLKREDNPAYTTLSGIATASGPNLGLELGSYLHARGADATVITTVT
jgi:hypothetical protein